MVVPIVTLSLLLAFEPNPFTVNSDVFLAPEIQGDNMHLLSEGTDTSFPAGSVDTTPTRSGVLTRDRVEMTTRD